MSLSLNVTQCFGGALPQSGRTVESSGEIRRISQSNERMDGRQSINGDEQSLSKSANERLVQSENADDIKGNDKLNTKSDISAKKNQKIVTKNAQEIKEFIDEARSLKGNETKNKVFNIAKEQVDTIKKALGIDLSRFKRVFESGYIKHAFKRHGQGSKDARPITDDDFLRYEDIVTYPDRVSKSVTDDGKPAIVSVKRYDDAVYVIEEVRATVNENKNRLVFRTMFKSSVTNPDEAIRNIKKSDSLKFVDVEKRRDAGAYSQSGIPRAKHPKCSRRYGYYTANGKRCQ